MLISIFSYILVAAIGVGIGSLITRKFRKTKSDTATPTEDSGAPLQTEHALPLQTLLMRTTNEMRTPLNSIVGLSSVLEDSKLTLQQRENVSMIRIAGDNLLSLIKDIQYYTRIENGSEQSEIANFKVVTVIEEVIEEFLDILSSKPIEVTISIAPEIPRIIAADTSHIRMILSSLLSNAAKYTRSGEIEIIVSHEDSAANDQKFIKFQVKDTGIGISEEQLSSIFSPINPETLRTEDFLFGGFGLYISQKMCELMGGKMSASSREYEGSTFTFTAPYSEIEPGAATDIAETNSPFAHKHHIILATVSQNLAESLKQYFTRLDILVSIISDEVELAQALVQPPVEGHVLLFDSGWIERPSDIQHTWSEMLKNCALPTIILGTHSFHETLEKDPVFSQLARIQRPIRPTKILEGLRRAKVPKEIHDSTRAPFASKEMPQKSTPGITPGTSDGLKILVAEDDKVNQKVISMMIKRLGHTSDLAVDGAEAVEMAAKTDYDLIFMDLNMPNLSGIEATKVIFENYSNPDNRPTVVAITAAVTPANQQACREVGMKGFISKPVKLAVLKKALTSLKPKAAPLAN